MPLLSLGGELNLFAIDRTTNKAGTIAMRWVPTDHPGRLAEEAALLANTHSVWWGIDTRNTRLTKGRGGAGACVLIPGLWVDIDSAGPAKNATAPPTATTRPRQCEDYFDDYLLEPTAIINGGHI